MIFSRIQNRKQHGISIQKSRKTIAVPAEWKGKHVDIAFDGVFLTSRFGLTEESQACALMDGFRLPATSAGKQQILIPLLLLSVQITTNNLHRIGR